MVRREIWPFLKGSHISETKEATPTKTGVHAHDINSYLHKFFEPISIEPERLRSPKSVCMHLTSIPTCMNFFGAIPRRNVFCHFITTCIIKTNKEENYMYIVTQHYVNRNKKTKLEHYMILKVKVYIKTHCSVTC